MTGISVIIPTYNDDFELTGLLAYLARRSVQEVIIVDGERRTEPDFGFHYPSLNIIWTNAEKGRGSQINAGLQRATQEYVWVLHADCRPQSGSAQAIRTYLQNPRTSLFCFPLSFRRKGRALSLYAWFSRFDSFLTTFGDQGFAFRKSDYDRLNVDLRDYPLLEDVVLRSRLKRLGAIRKAKIKLPTSARRFERLGMLRTQLRNIGILLSYWRGVSPSTLHAKYYATILQTAPMSRLS